ncbi:hypothetical protein CS8_059760 [Cupriavidus sp. 8B]
MRKVVTNCSGVSPLSCEKRRANVARDTWHTAASDATDHGSAGARSTASIALDSRASAISASRLCVTPPCAISARNSKVSNAVESCPMTAVPPGSGACASLRIMLISASSQAQSARCAVATRSTGGSLRNSIVPGKPSTNVPHSMSSGCASPGIVTSVSKPLKRVVWAGMAACGPATSSGRLRSVCALPCGNSSTSPASREMASCATSARACPFRMM